MNSFPGVTLKNITCFITSFFLKCSLKYTFYRFDLSSLKEEI